MRGTDLTAEFARELSGLWGLGAPAGEPGALHLGIGDHRDAALLAELCREGSLAGAVVLVGSVSAGARIVSGTAQFDPGTRVDGEFTILDGDPVVSSNLGTHAVREGNVLTVGYDPEAGLGRADSFWVFEAIRDFATEMGLILRVLPPVGCMRLDDTPGTAQHQLEGRAKSDRRQARRLAGLARTLDASGSVLNLAVAAEAFDDGVRVPLERVWPRAIAEIRKGVEAGVFEPVCHGVLHLDTDRLGGDEIEFREFQSLEPAAAGERLDQAIAWQRGVLGDPRSFVAPAWAYGPAGDSEAARRGLYRWHRPRVGPVFESDRLHETLYGDIPGLHGVDYSPLVRLAKAGVPPTVTTHGMLHDGRVPRQLARENPLLMARLSLRRDLDRIAAVDGITWVGAGEFCDLLAGHTMDEASVQT
ncbi:MAG: hypothetical protein U0R51_10845 [Solirubrobacterales bacterium]